MAVNVEQVKALLNDEVFLNECSEAQSVEEITQLFQARGVELTCQQVDSLLAAAMASNVSDEISESDLDDVVGGVSILGTIKKCIQWFKKGWEWGSKFYEWEQSLYR